MMQKEERTEQQNDDDDDDDVATGVYKISIQNENAQNLDFKITPLVEKCLNIKKFDDTDKQKEAKHDKELIYLAANDNLSTLKVEYIPKGKLITVNVSLMW